MFLSIQIWSAGKFNFTIELEPGERAKLFGKTSVKNKKHTASEI